MKQTSTVTHAEKPPSYGALSIAAQLDKYARAMFSNGSWTENDANLLNHTVSMASPSDLQYVAWANFRTLANHAKSHFIESGQFKQIELSEGKAP